MLLALRSLLPSKIKMLMWEFIINLWAYVVVKKSKFSDFFRRGGLHFILLLPGNLFQFRLRYLPDFGHLMMPTT